MIKNQSKDYLFDHLVIIGRDKLQALAHLFSAKGFQLTPLAHHNLGSINQLIMLDSTYIELLGWESDKPIQRAEIANQAIGLDALVFRTNDAEQTYQQLLAKGFAVNPVQNLSRESEFLGKSVLVEFKTIRFSKQPIPGVRIYFCEHLSPEYVWQDQWLAHHNQITHLKTIVIASPDVKGNIKLLSQLLNLNSEHVITKEESAHLTLLNIELNLQKAAHLNEARILNAQVCKTASDPVDLSIDSHFLKNI